MLLYYFVFYKKNWNYTRVLVSRFEAFNIAYSFYSDKIRAFAKSRDNIKLAEIAIDTPSDILCWKLPEPNLSDCVCIYLGVENQTFFNLTVSVKGRFFIYKIDIEYLTNYVNYVNF